MAVGDSVFLKLKQIFSGWSFDYERPANMSDYNQKLMMANSYDEFSDAYQNALFSNTSVYKGRLNRMQLYQEYLEMETYSPLISSFLDVISEDATQFNYDLDRTFWVQSKDGAIADELDGLLQNVVDVEDIIWAFGRQLALFGDYFLRPDIIAGQGVTFVEPVSPFNTFPEYFRRRLKGYKISDSKLAPPWTFVHARLPGRDLAAGMGDSFLWNLRILFRQIKMSEDAVLFYRLTRAATRWVWKIDVGQMSPENAFKYLDHFRKRYQKKPYVNPATGEFSTTQNPWSYMEDVFIPTRKDSVTGIEQLSTGVNISDLADLDMMYQKMFSAMKVPPAYMGYPGEGEYRAADILTNQDMRYARTVYRLSRGIKNALTTLCDIHLAGKKVEPEKFYGQYKIQGTEVSQLAELNRIRNLQERTQAASELIRIGDEIGLPKDKWSAFVLIKVLGLSDTEAETISKGLATSLEVSEKENKVMTDLLEKVVTNPEGYLKEDPAMLGELRNKLIKHQVDSSRANRPTLSKDSLQKIYEGDLKG